MLLPLLLCACSSHKADLTQQAQLLAPPLPETPEPKPDSTAADLQPSEPVKFPAPPPPKVVVKPQEPVKKPRKQKSAPAKPPVTSTPAAPPPSQPAQVASNDAPPPEVSAIGSLTTGEPDADKKEARNEINAVEKGLSSISRKLSDNEEKTSSQIREYLKQALTALNTGDLEGARTLTQKAKLLLGELSQ